MGYNLIGAHNDFRVGSGTWGRILRVALDHGWEPAGTLAPNIGSHDENGEWVPDDIGSAWDGTYFFNNYQIVTEEDAAALANALERALPDIPDADPGVESVFDDRPDLVLLGGPEGKRYLRQLLTCT